MSANTGDSEVSGTQKDADVLLGQKLAFAAASLVLGVCSFVQLLAMEKAILAIVFGVLALREGPGRLHLRRGFARFGIVLGVLYILIVVVMLILHWDDVMRFFEFVERFQSEG